MPTAEEHERGLARFVVAPRRPRWLAALGDDRARAKLYAALPRFAHNLDPAYATPAEEDAVHALVLQAGAPPTAYLLSTSTLDRTEQPLADALLDVVWDASGFVSCIPGHLAVYRSQPPHATLLVLRRP